MQHQRDTQLMRITNHGKMNAWISFALDFLEKNADRPLVLHTLPATATQSDSNKHVPGETQPILVPENPAPAQQPDPPAPGKASLSTATMTVPRLVSVVEIIKREYLKTLETKHSSKLSGLHQYNEIGCLEDLGLDEGMDTREENRKITLAMALEGKNHLKQKQTPFMRITLSQCALPELVEQGATYQPPIMRKLSKSARARAKKRENNAKEADEISIIKPA